MVKLIPSEPGECEESYGSALCKRLEKIQFKTLKPLVWKSLTQERFLMDLSQMGLSSFFRSSFVQGDEALCREFLCSYKKQGSGTVRQQVVHTDPRVVELVLKLPRNASKPVKEAPKLSSEELFSLYNGPTVKVKHNGYSVKALCDPHFKEFVGFLVDRMSCKVNCTYVSAEILYAAKHVWETKAVLDWAGYMSHRIQAQCEKVRGTSQSAFEYTQYLTQIIQYQLGMAFDFTGGDASSTLELAAHEKDASMQLRSERGLEGGEEVDNKILDSKTRQPGYDGHGEKRAKRQIEGSRSSKKMKNEKCQSEGAESALSLLGKVSSWIRSQSFEQEQQKHEFEQAEKRVAELETEVNEMKARYEAAQARQVQWEVQFNLVQQEKLVLQDQVQALVAQQAALRQRLELYERERAQMSEQVKVAQAYFSRAMNGKKEDGI